jgi:hypothetical protein
MNAVGKRVKCIRDYSEMKKQIDEANPPELIGGYQMPELYQILTIREDVYVLAGEDASTSGVTTMPRPGYIHCYLFNEVRTLVKDSQWPEIFYRASNFSDPF